MTAISANDTALPGGVFELHQCVALVTMSAMALEADGRPEADVVQMLRRTLSLAAALGQQGIEEIESDHRHPKTGCRSGC